MRASLLFRLKSPPSRLHIHWQPNPLLPTGLCPSRASSPATVPRLRACANTARLKDSKLREASCGNIKKSALSRISHRRLESSYSTYAAFVTLALAAALLVDYFTQSSTPISQSPSSEEEIILPPSEKDDRVPDYDAMPIQQGFLGNLTPEQEQKLQDFWALVLKTFKVEDPISANGSADRPITPAQPATTTTEQESAGKKEKHGLFHRKKKDSVAGLDSPGSPGKGDPEDKYGQTKELQDILANASPELLRETFWTMAKKDNPDTLMLRFLRARKWDIQRALAMLITTMHWRKNDMHVDDDVVKHGEGGALIDAQSSDATKKKDGNDFMAQLRLGKSFLHGVDKEGRPICFVRVRLHRSGEQSERSLERYTVYVIETTRLALMAPVETATIVFDMTSFTMANMDYTPVKFMIKVFEANYPESLGSVLVHKAPWIFQGIWKIIRGWLDPVVANKVHFTNNVEELSAYIPKSQIIKELGGDENWEYKYVEPIANENALMQDTETRTKLEEERKLQVKQYELKTFEWIHGSNVKSEREAIASQLRENYWKLDPYVRARTLYDRTGMIEKSGNINFYPTQTLKAENVNGQVATSADDVD